MKITKLWVVHDPTPHSLLIDILYETDVPGLARLAIGTGASEWEQENTTLYTDGAEAKRDAMLRIVQMVKSRGASMDTSRIIARYLKASDEVAMDFDTPEAMQEYLKEHPGADRTKHHVRPPEDKNHPSPDNDLSDEEIEERSMHEDDAYEPHEDLEPDDDQYENMVPFNQEKPDPKTHQHYIVAKRIVERSRKR